MERGQLEAIYESARQSLPDRNMLDKVEVQVLMDVREYLDKLAIELAGMPEGAAVAMTVQVISLRYFGKKYY